MIPDLDIYRAANLLIMKYGRHAPNHAGVWADAMLEAGDSNGHAAFKRILRAVEELKRAEPTSGEAVH